MKRTLGFAVGVACGSLIYDFARHGVDHIEYWRAIFQGIIAFALFMVFSRRS